MTKDAYWDELGIAWVAIEPESGVTSPLRGHLRRQARLIGAALALLAALSLAGLCLGIATIWLGANSGAWNLITRGTAILAIATLAGIAAGGFAGVRRGDDARAVSEMIELSIRSAKRWLLAIRLALYGCVVAAAFGLIGATIRTHLSNPPKMSPVIDLILLTVIALALSLFRYRAKVALAKFEYLQRTLAADTA